MENGKKLRNVPRKKWDVKFNIDMCSSKRRPMNKQCFHRGNMIFMKTSF